MAIKTFEDGSTYGTKELAATVVLAATMVAGYYGAKAVVRKAIFSMNKKFGNNE